MSQVFAEAEVVIDVPFHDVDSMNIVWHGNYVKYFEIARCAMLDTIGYNYLQMMESGYGWPVVDLHARYVKPVRFMDKIRVRARLVEYELRLKVEYLVTDMEGRKLTKGHTVQVAVEIATGEMQFASPAILAEKLGIVA